MNGVDNFIESLELMMLVNSAGRFGRCFEEFNERDTYRHWPAKTVNKHDCHLFSLLTMNHHPLHIDSVFAARSQHGQVLVVETHHVLSDDRKIIVPRHNG